MQYQKTLLAQSVLALTLAANVNAANHDNIEEMIVVANRIEMPLRQQSAAISVVDAKTIERRGQASLMDVLRSEPAINVSNSGGPGKVSALRIRGEEGFRTKVYVDGIDVSDPTGTQIGPQIQHISSAGITRVEILRGAQGLVYGADAGGVILVDSRQRQAGLSGSLQAEAGRYGTRNWSANVALNEEQGDISVGLSKFDSDGFNARTLDASGELDGYENTTAHIHGGVNFADSWRLSATLRDVDSRAGYDGFSAGSNHVNFSDYDQRMARVALSKKGQSWDHELAYSHSETERENIADFGFSAEGEIVELQYLGAYKSEQNTIVYGLERETQKDILNTNERDQDSVFIDWQWQTDNQLFINAGIRHDDNDDFGTHNSYRLGAAYLLPSVLGELKLKASWGTGFRAPSLSELAYNRRPFAPASILAVNLKEEKTNSYDVGAQLFLNNGGQLELVYFDQRVEDEIYFDLRAFSGYLQGNGESRSKGVELAFQQPLTAQFNVYANATYNDTQTVPNSAGLKEQRLRRPRVLLNAGFDYSWLNDSVVLSANLRHVGEIRDVAGHLDGYQIMDLGLRWSATRSLDVFARVQNALDETYQEVSSYNSAGAAVYAGFKLSL